MIGSASKKDAEVGNVRDTKAADECEKDDLRNVGRLAYF